MRTTARSVTSSAPCKSQFSTWIFATTLLRPPGKVSHLLLSSLSSLSHLYVQWRSWWRNWVPFARIGGGYCHIQQDISLQLHTESQWSGLLVPLQGLLRIEGSSQPSLPGHSLSIAYRVIQRRRKDKCTESSGRGNFFLAKLR